MRTARRLTGREYLDLDYPTSAAPGPRWGHGRPPHAGLERAVAAHDAAYAGALDVIAGYCEDLLAVDRRPTKPAEPYWLSEWLPGLDAAALYAFLRDRSPRRYLEVGSGVSTAWAARARRDGGLDTEIVSIDPQPRAEVDAVCDRAVRCALETADLGLFSELVPGDVVFMDGSHRAFPNSDAVVFFLEVLPQLPAGVLVGVHDVFLPDDYPSQFAAWHWSEQYLLATLLLAGAPYARPALASWYVSARGGALDELWEDERLRDVERRGWAFWLHTAE